LGAQIKKPGLKAKFKTCFWAKKSINQYKAATKRLKPKPKRRPCFNRINERGKVIKTKMKQLAAKANFLWSSER
jgi:hypothetical protein